MKNKVYLVFSALNIAYVTNGDQFCFLDLRSLSEEQYIKELRLIGYKISDVVQVTWLDHRFFCIDLVQILHEV